MSKTPTLEGVQAEHKKLGEMIARLIAQATTEFLLPETEIQLKHGEQYAGIILGKDGEPSTHLILLPEAPEGTLNWKAAMDWAKSVGGELPTRREQSLLYANLKEEFEEAWYWSQEQHATHSDYAWMQFFDNGGQNYYRKSSNCRARAVRRLVIE